MVEAIDGLNRYFSSLDRDRVETPEEIELAFQLQNSRPNDPDVLERLVYSYTGDLYRWLNVLMYFSSGNDPTHEEIFLRLKETFTEAIGHIEQFHGQASVPAWLFAIGYRVVKREYLRNWVNGNGDDWNHRDTPEDLSIEKQRAYWSSVINLAEKLRTPLLSRYLFNIKIAEIASILNLQPEEVHSRMSEARQHLLVRLVKSHVDEKIQAALDGILISNHDEYEQLILHLSECESCRLVAQKLVKLDQTLGEKIKLRWATPDPNVDDLRALVKTILWEVKQPKTWWKLKASLAQVIWIAGLSLIFIGLAVVFIRVTPVEKEFPQEAIPTSTPLPPPIDVPRGVALSQTISSYQDAPEYITHAFSADGKWAAITSIRMGWGFMLPTNELYNLETHTSEFITQNTNPIPESWLWINLTPSISGDGRWIAYVNIAENPNGLITPCGSGFNGTCLDIFLYDRIEKTNRKITLAADGEPANGDSLAPTISEDGHWLAFWSTATNLIDGTEVSCRQGEKILTCLYIYLYDLQNAKFTMISTNTFHGYPKFGVDRISLSADGRYVGFTITPGAQIQSSLKVSIPNVEVQNNPMPGNIFIPESPVHRSEAVVFDRMAGTFEWVNQVSDGMPGDAESSSPVLSADGRYVTFIAASTNLVPGDSNGKSDVFVRDRMSGIVEIVSVNYEGRIGKGEDGLTFWDRGYYNLDISNDGRFVLFESNAKDLVPNLPAECSENASTECNSLYLYDRQTSKIELITMLTNGGFPYLPDLSPDGRLVTFTQSLNFCRPFQYACSDVMRFDRLRGWMYNLTRHSQELAILPVPYLGTITLPWLSWESSALAFSPDGSMIAVGSIDSKVRLWLVPWKSYGGNHETPIKVLSVNKNEHFTVVTYTPDGEWLAAGTASGVVYIWDVKDGKLLYKLDNQLESISKIVFSKDRGHLIIATINRTWIWSIDIHQLIKVSELFYGEKTVFSVDISPAGDMLATSRSDGSIWLQRLPGGQSIGRLGTGEYTGSDLAFSPDGRLLAAHSHGGNIDLWQITAIDSDKPSITYMKTFHFNAYGGDLVFSADNTYLALSRIHGALTLWNIPEERFYTLPTNIPDKLLYSMAFSDQGDKLAAIFEDQIVLWGMPTITTSDYFVQSTHDSYIDAEPFPPATANDLSGFFFDANNVVGDHLNLDKTKSYLEFPLYIPAHLPQNINFREAEVYEDGSVLLTYEISSQGEYIARLYIYEKSIPSSSVPTMTTGADVSPIPTQLWTEAGRITGEYVRGDWINTQTYTYVEGGSLSGVAHSVWRWDYGSNSQRLRWQQNGILIGLYYQVGTVYTQTLQEQWYSNELPPVNTLLEQSDLIQIANGMRLLTEVDLETIH